MYSKSIVDEVKKIKQLIDGSSKVLITSHISPDPDALCSVLLLGQTLKKNFPQKQIKLALEETLAWDLSFLQGYADVEFGSIVNQAKKLEPDLIIIVDAASLDRVSRNDSDELKKLVSEQNIKMAAIDHHPKEESLEVDIYINDKKAAAVQQIYELAFNKLGLEKPDGYAETTLLGILRDTGRFKYDNPDHKKTFELVSQLLDAGASIEKLEFKLERYSQEELEVLAHLIGNSKDSGQGYTYTFVNDDFAEKWESDGKTQSGLKAGSDVFSGQFLRNVGGNFWGFIVYPEFKSNPKSYSVSFRSVSGGVDVAAIAAKLGGGGHEPAAGAKNIQAKNIAEAIQKVERVISPS